MQGRLILRLMVVALLAVKPAYAGVSYSFGSPVDAFDAAFYAGEAIDGSDVAGRFVLQVAPSNDGRTLAAVTVNRATFQSSVFLVDVGSPSSWRRLSADDPQIEAFTAWVPDDSAVLWGSWRIPIATGAYEYNLFPDYGAIIGAMTSLTEENWMAAALPVSGGVVRQVVLLPILPDGTHDVTRQTIAVTNFQDPAIDVSVPVLSPDGNAVTFSIASSQPLPAADLSDVYAINDIVPIRNAPKIPTTDLSTLAPTLVTDPAITDIRASESSNFVHGMAFSPDRSLVIYQEDFNNVFNNDDFFTTAAAGNWDIMVSNADGSGVDSRLTLPGNQFLISTFHAGSRVTYDGQAYTTDSLSMHGYIANLEVKTDVPGNDLGNNDVETTIEVLANDGTGTEVAIPSGTTINFPDGEPQEIQVTTPISPVTESQLPPGETVDAIPVVREFGPDGTTFDPPIEVTMSYTDAEIAGLDETTLTPYLFNEQTQVFDLPIPPEDIISTDPVTRAVKFRVSHFSIYGLGAQQIALSARSWEMYP